MNKQISRNRSGRKRRDRGNIRRIHEAWQAGDMVRLRRALHAVVKGSGVALQAFPKFGGSIWRTSQLVGAQTFATKTGATGDAVVATATTALQVAFAFSIADLAQFSSFSALFDQYRFEKIRLRFLYRGTAGVTNQTSSSPNTLLPLMYVVVDYDDANTLADKNAAREYDNCQIVRPGESLELEFVPSFAPATYAGGAFTGYAVVPSPSMWLDIASSGILQYGVKAIIDPLTTASTENIVWDVEAQYDVSFANTR